jgi:hypothetical protein
MLNLAVVYSELDLDSRAMETLHAVLMLDPGIIGFHAVQVRRAAF